MEGNMKAQIKKFKGLSKKEKESIKIKNYPYLVVFNSQRCDLKLPKEKEQRLKEIIEEIKILSKELEGLFKR